MKSAAINFDSQNRHSNPTLTKQKYHKKMPTALTFLILTVTIFTTTISATDRRHPPPTPPSVLNAADALANSGHNSMSLTLELIAPNLNLPAASLTVFSPPDSAFYASGQPTLSHLLLHFSPLSLPSSSLSSLPLFSSFPSLSPSKQLTITSKNPISINNVKLSSQYPIFDDGFVVVYALDAFFDFETAYNNETNSKKRDGPELQCFRLEMVSIFNEASGVLKSRGYSVIASFLDIQLMGFLENSLISTKWTVFAPVDEHLVKYSGDFLQYFSLFTRHMAPCKVGWDDLDEMKNGTVVSKNVDGFHLVVTKDEYDEMVMINGVEVTAPEMYEDSWLVVHGINGVIALPENDTGDFAMKTKQNKYADASTG